MNKLARFIIFLSVIIFFGCKKENQRIRSSDIQIDIKGQHTLLLKADGTLWTCGYNIAGQLGDSTGTNRANLKLIATEVKSIQA